jgi:hypothetical protein
MTLTTHDTFRKGALIATTLALGFAAHVPGEATASTREAAEQRVGHTVKRITVRGSFCHPDAPALPPAECQGLREDRPVDVHLWYPADHRGLSEKPKTVYKSALHGEERIPDGWDPLSWTVEAEIARENAAIDPQGMRSP